MAIIDPTIEKAEPGKTKRVIWVGLANGDSGAPVSFPGAADYSWHALETFSIGGTVVLEGSLEKTPVNYYALKDPQGNDLSLTAAGGDMVSEMCMHIRPRVTAGDGSTSITVIVLFRSTMR